MGLGERRLHRMDGVNPVALGAPAPLLVLDLTVALGPATACLEIPKTT